MIILNEAKKTSETLKHQLKTLQMIQITYNNKLQETEVFKEAESFIFDKNFRI